MKHLMLCAGALALMTGTALAAVPTAAQHDEFYKTCVGISSNTVLCKCKADAAMSLVDASFMAVIIASMRGRTLDPKYNAAYGTYMAASTKACGMGEG